MAKNMVKVNGTELTISAKDAENVKECVYLGSTLTRNNDCSAEISRRITKATGVMASFNTIWKSKVVSNPTKLLKIRAYVWSVALCAHKTRTLKNRDGQAAIIGF